jgi:hypothetical protein
MSRLAGTFALIGLLASGVVAAQSMQTSPASQYPSSTAPATSATQPQESGSTNSASTGKADKKAQLKDCVAQQRANNPQMSKHDATKTCKSQMNSSSQGQ